MECGAELVLKECINFGLNEGEIPFCPVCSEFRFPMFNVAVSTIIFNKDFSKTLLIQQYGRKNNILVAGYVTKGENLAEALKREIKEETGIILKNQNFKPFAKAISYYKNWPEKGKNRKTEINYYELKTDEKPNLNNTEYTESEKDGHFELKYIPLENVQKILKENAKKYGDKKGITKEMLEIFNLYKSLN